MAAGRRRGYSCVRCATKYETTLYSLGAANYSFERVAPHASPTPPPGGAFALSPDGGDGLGTYEITSPIGANQPASRRLSP